MQNLSICGRNAWKRKKKSGKACFLKKLDGVGPVDKRPSTNKLHHIVKKKRKKVTCDT